VENALERAANTTAAQNPIQPSISERAIDFAVIASEAKQSIERQ
jgi:hypothetical protein